MTENELLETPIAELEQFGLSTTMISCLESHFGLLVVDLCGVTEDRLRELPRVSNVRIAEICNALRLFFHTKGDWNEDDDHCRTEPRRRVASRC